MKPTSLPCAIYTRKSSEEGLEQGFNSLDAQREASNAYILSQKALGWSVLPVRYAMAGSPVATPTVLPCNASSQM